MSELSHRAKQILYAAVTEFVATGEPVGSRTLAKKCNLELSPASIRNILSDLEDAGYLHQPHTSAGRVPTDLAFRLFVDALMQVKEVTQEDHARIRLRFERMGPRENLLRETGRLLSELTGTAAVVIAPKADALRLRKLSFLRTKPGEFLAVLIMSDGTVQNRFVASDLSDRELTRVQNLLDDVTEGRTIGELRTFFERRLASNDHDLLRHQAYSLGGEAVHRSIGEGADVVIEGQAKLVQHAEFADATGFQRVVTALDERETIVRLLDATIASGGATVVVGRESGVGEGHFAFIAAPYHEDGRPAGSVGVIGPTRMDYPTVVPLVTATATAVTEFLDRRRKDEGSE